MQIKDRHNGNILLHKEGYILHIDFGFFFSNAPGKGLAFEQNVPFKLLSEYIEILGVSIANCSMNSEDYFSSKYIYR